MTPPAPLDQHNVEIERNLQSWNRKPVLRRAYREFHERIAAHLDRSLSGTIVEVGSDRQYQGRHPGLYSHRSVRESVDRSSRERLRAELR